MTIIEDTGQKVGLHVAKNKYWKSQSIEVIRHPLPVGDYILVNDRVQDVIDRKAARGIPVKKMDFLGTYDVCIDSKYSIAELAADVCGKQHERFRDEAILAQNNGIKLYIVVENDPELVYHSNGTMIINSTITDLRDLHKWVNPRLWILHHGKQKYPSATRGLTLMKACMTMRAKYGVEFVFCSSKDSGRIIVDLLTKNDELHK